MESILNFLLSRVKILIRLDIIIIFFLLSLYICSEIFYEPVKLDSPILVADSSLQVTSSELSKHNLDLISSLQMRESLGANSILSNSDGLRQTRSIYIGMVGILLTLIFSINGKHRIYLIILSLIVIFYGLDIHLSDLIQRSTDSNQITSHSLEIIVNQKPADSIWYDLNYSKRNSQYPVIHDTRIFRKLKAAFYPDIVQIVFFVLPLVTIYIISTFRYRKKIPPNPRLNTDRSA